MARLMTAAAVLFLATATARADHVHPELVDAEARWMAFFDLEGLVQSRMFQEVRQRQGEEMDEKIREVQAETGIHPLQDLKSVTLYGMDESEQNGVLVLHGSAALDGLLDRIGQVDGYHTEQVRDYTLHVVGQGGDGMVGALLTTKGGGRLVAVSRHQAQLVQALDVLHGRAPSLLTQEGRIQARSSQGALMMITANLDGSRLQQMEPVSRVARMAEHVHLEMGERGDDLFLDANLTTRSDAEARSITQIVQGAMALVDLAAQNEADRELEMVRNLLSGVEAAAEGKQVHLSFTVSLDTVLKMAGERGGF